jgi:hypothetical protein
VGGEEEPGLDHALELARDRHLAAGLDIGELDSTELAEVSRVALRDDALNKSGAKKAGLE